MSAMSQLHLAIQEELEKGELSFFQIAQKLEIPEDWVMEVAMENDDEKDFK